MEKSRNLKKEGLKSYQRNRFVGAPKLEHGGGERGKYKNSFFHWVSFPRYRSRWNKKKERKGAEREMASPGGTRKGEHNLRLAKRNFKARRPRHKFIGERGDETEKRK